MDLKNIVLEFISRINAGDVDSLCALMTEDHLFVDCLGRKTIGREVMREGWAHYFLWFPDYRIKVIDVLSSSDTVAIFGEASGTFHFDGLPVKDGSWKTPAAWKAVVKDALVAEWRVYTDNKPVYEILARHGIIDV